jgi:ribosome-binding factor A
MATNRIEKVNSLLEHEISKILVRDFGFAGSLITLTHVDTSPNLIQAKAYISVMPEGNSDAIIETLNKGAYDVQQKINKLLNMRPIPKIRFVKDENVSEAARIEKILGQIEKEGN